MATNLNLDDALIKEAVKIGEHKSKKDAVTAALKEYILRHKQRQVLNLFNTIDYDKKYNYKLNRKRNKEEK